MKHSIKVGLSFGSTSGIITVLGLMIGLTTATQSKSAVIGGIITIAVADSLSDGLGVHMAEESENVHTHSQIWISTIVTIVSKFLFSIIFLIPVLLFSLHVAVKVTVGFGVGLILLLSYCVARKQKSSNFLVISEHILITILVVVATYYVGRCVNYYCG